jgi:hypothetical protein
MKLAPSISRALDCECRHPARALSASMALWVAGFTIYWNVTAHSRFNDFHIEAREAIRFIETLSKC